MDTTSLELDTRQNILLGEFEDRLFCDIHADLYTSLRDRMHRDLTGSLHGSLEMSLVEDIRRDG